MAGDLSHRYGTTRFTPEGIALHREAICALAHTLTRAAVVVVLARMALAAAESHVVAQAEFDLTSRALPSGDLAAAYRQLDAAAAGLRLCAEHARELVSALARVGDAYAFAEAQNHRMLRLTQGAIAATLGALAPLLGLLFARILLPPTVALAWLEAVGPGRLDSALLEQRGLINSAFFVEAVRTAVMSSDDFAGGVLGLPPVVVAALGDQGVALTGVATSAALVAALAQRVDLLRETPVRVRRRSALSVAPPHGIEDRVARIPRGNGTSREQVRIERYERADGGARFEVYIGGTIDGSPKAGGEAWDMTSNVHGLSGGSPASLRGVEEALARAGARPEDPIVITGYSQGALVGALLAASGDHNVEALLEVGGPSGQVPVPASVAHVRLDHTSDVVTALGGDVRGAHTLRLQRDPLAAGLVNDDGSLLPAHNLALYTETAALADRYGHPDAQQALAEFRAPDTAREGEATTWRVDRLDGPSTGAFPRSGAAQAR